MKIQNNLKYISFSCTFFRKIASIIQTSNDELVLQIDFRIIFILITYFNELLKQCAVERLEWQASISDLINGQHPMNIQLVSN